jgi:4-amino-4-deoxy-L-arabinose transferase-like glycosyltransferase
MRTTALLALVFGSLYLVGLGDTALVDRDEAAYAEVTREMVARGDLLVPYYNGAEIFDKPPLLYWIQASGYRLFGVGELGARIGNALAALASLLCLYGFARRPLGERAAALSAAVLGSSALFVILARMALTDMLLLLTSIVSLGALHRAAAAGVRGRAASAAWLALAGAAAGAGMLAKGALGVLLPALAGGIWALAVGSARPALRPSGVAAAALLAIGVGGSWYALLGATQPGGLGFLRELFLENHLHRFSSPMQGHSGPFFYYAPVLLLGFLPWSALLPLAVARARWRPLDADPGRFLALFALFSVLAFALFSAAATKLPHYVLPVLPGAALCVGHLLARERGAIGSGDRGWAWTLGASAALLLGAALACLALPWALGRLPGWLGEHVEVMPGLLHPFATGALPALAAGILATGAGALGLAWRRGAPGVAAAALAGAAVALFALVVAVALPRFDDHFFGSLERLSRAAGELAPEHEEVLLFDLRHRPSVQFYARRRTASVRPSDGAARLFGGPAARIVITTDLALEQLEALGPIEVIARDRGYVLLRSLPARGDGA